MSSLSRLAMLIGLNFWSYHPVSGSSNYSVIHLDRISPPTLQLESMSSDSLQGRPLFEDATGDLWFGGEKNLWRWNLASSSVTRFELPAGVIRPFRLLTVNGQEITGFDRHRLWNLDQQKKTWRAVELDFKSDCPLLPATFARASKPGFQFVLSRCGGCLISPKEMVPRVDKSDYSYKDNVFSMAYGSDEQGEFVLFTQKRTIFRYRMKSEASVFEKVYASKSDLRGIVGGDSYFYAWTAKAIVVFDQTMHRQKVIPVVGQRQLAAFGVTPEFHALVFDDGTLELMDIKSKKKWYSIQSMKFAQYVDFIGDGKYLMVSAETGQPQVFRVTTAN